MANMNTLRCIALEPRKSRFRWRSGGDEDRCRRWQWRGMCQMWQSKIKIETDQILSPKLTANTPKNMGSWEITTFLWACVFHCHVSWPKGRDTISNTTTFTASRCSARDFTRFQKITSRKIWVTQCIQQECYTDWWFQRIWNILVKIWIFPK